MKNFLLIGLVTLLFGISWLQGAPGNPGTNCSGPLTVQPQSGNTGQSAITLVDLGLAVPAPAVGQYTLSIASGMLLESDNGNSYHSLVGPLGPQGPQGAAGAAGPAGAQGVQGVGGGARAGRRGLAGATGPSGPAGAQGAQGFTGAAGPAGSTGAQGPLGPPGTLAAPSDYNFSGWGSFSAAAGTSEVGNSLYRNQIDMLSATAVRLVLTLGMYPLPSGSYARAEYTPDGTNWFALSGTVPVTAPYGIYTSGWQGLPTGANGDHVVRIVTFNAASRTTQCSLYQLHLQFK